VVIEEKGPARFALRELLALDGDAGARKGPGTSVDGLASLRHWPSTLHSRAEREGESGARRRERSEKERAQREEEGGVVSEGVVWEGAALNETYDVQ
jgi:hypothetical protein